MDTRFITGFTAAALVTASVTMAQPTQTSLLEARECERFRHSPLVLLYGLVDEDCAIMEREPATIVGNKEIPMGHWSISTGTELGAFIVAENDRLAAHMSDMNQLAAELVEINEAKQASIQARMDGWLWFTKAGRKQMKLHKRLIDASVEYEIAIRDVMKERQVSYYSDRDARVMAMASAHGNAYYPLDEWAALISVAIEDGAWLKPANEK